MKQILLLLFLLLLPACELINPPAKMYPVTYGSNPNLSETTLKVYFINVSQGDSELIIFPDNTTMLIDAGTEKEANNILNLFKKLGIKEIDTCVKTHNHADHTGGFNLVAGYCKRIITNINLKSIRIESNREYKITYLTPYAISGYFTNENDNSIVIKIDYNNNQILFTGDCEAACEEKIMSYGSINAKVLKVAHHGSKTSTSKNFLEKVNPSYAFIEVGENSYGHPSEEVLSRLQERNIQTFRTDAIAECYELTMNKEITIEKCQDKE